MIARMAAVLGVCFLLGCSSRHASEFPERIDVDLGTHRIEAKVLGASNGKPVVVIESGLGGKIDDWTEVQEMLAKETQVVCYNRAGTGGSQPGPEPRDAAKISSELRDALSELGIAPPFILVGHSLGGIYVRRFAVEYADSVAGVVLLDPTMEFTQPLSESRIKEELREYWASEYDEIESLLRRLHPKTSLMAAQSLLELEPYLSSLPIEDLGEQRAVWLELCSSRARQLEGMLGVLSPAQRSEFLASADSMEQIRGSTIHAPLRLLAAGDPSRPVLPKGGFPSEVMTDDYFAWANELRMTRYDEFVRSQPNASVQTVKRAGHNIHRQRPRLVAEAIMKMLPQ